MMSWLFLLACALTLDATILQYPGLVEVVAGRTARLNCSMDGMPATFCYAIIWSRVDFRTKKLISFKNTATNDGVQQSECSFDIKNATAEDSGMYYCTMVYGKMVYLGNGSNVIVTQGRKTASPPPIEILRPSGDVHGSYTPLLCTISVVVPRVHIFWIIDGKEKSGSTESVCTTDGDKVAEFTQNLVLVSVEKWDRGAECTCVVEYDGRNTSKSVQKEADPWELCYATVASYRVVVTALCLLSWIMTITAGIFSSR